MAKTNQQIIVTEGDFGVEILTQFIDTSKKPVPIEGCSCKVKFSYDGNVISEKIGVVIDEPKGIVSVILDKEETQYSGLWTSYWICYDQFNNITTTENIYYYVQPAIGSVNNLAFTELLNYYNRDEVNDMFENILEHLNNYTLSKDDVEEYIKIYVQDNIDDDFIRQCILDAIGNASDYAKKQDVTAVSNNLSTLSQRVDRYNKSLEQEDINLSNNIETLENEINNKITQNNNRLETKINDNLNKVNKIKNRNATNDLINTNTSSISCNSSTYTFSVKEDKNMQSIAYGNNSMFVGFSLDDGANGIIIKYNMSGVEIGRSANLPTEHTSAMVYNNNNNKLYVANGGENAGAKIFIINPSSLTIEQTFDYSHLGTSALIAIDKDNNLLLHVGQGDESTKTIYKINNSNNAEPMFTINNLGTPQGLAIHYNSIFYLTNNGIYEIDFDGTILNTITLYNDNSEPQGLTIGQLNGSNVLMYGKNKYNSDTNVNTIYSITNLESHKKTSLRMIGSYSPKETSSLFLSPVMINFSVRKISGTWTNMNWTNMITGSDNIIKEITAGMNSSTGYYDVTIKLNVKLYSYAQCIVTPEQGLFIDGYVVHGQLDIDGQTIHVRFKKSDAEGIIDPNTLKDSHGIIVTLIGGMKI